MENKEFQINPLASTELVSGYFIVRNDELLRKELQTKLANLKHADAEVYFDFCTAMD